MQAVERLGTSSLSILKETGAMAQFFVRAILLSFKPPFRLGLILAHMEFIGVGSLFIVMLTGFFTGAVFTTSYGAVFTATR